MELEQAYEVVVLRKDYGIALSRSIENVPIRGVAKFEVSQR